MARLQPGSKKPATDTTAVDGAKTPPDAMTDALHATQQHTVPLLPSYEGDAPEISPQSASTPSTQTTFARRTLAPRPGNSSPSLSYPDRETRGPSAADVPSRDHSAIWRQNALSGQADAPSGAEDALPPVGRPTIGLPAITGAQLPAVTTTQRQLVPQRSEESGALLIRGATKPRAHTRMPVVPRRIKPRSFAAQFIVTMVSVMALFTALTLASPLAQTAAFSGTFQAYSNAVPWVPTATPTPKPTPTPVPYQPPVGANPGQQTIINEIVAVFGPNAQGALNIARCESGYDPNAVNPYAIGNSHASGVFQILYPSTWDGTSYASQSPFDYNANIHAAFEIFSRDGYSWREWACKPY